MPVPGGSGREGRAHGSFVFLRAACDSGSSCLWEGGGAQAEVEGEQDGGKEVQGSWGSASSPRSLLTLSPASPSSASRSRPANITPGNRWLPPQSLSLLDPAEAPVNMQIWSWPLSPNDRNRFREDRAQRRPHSASTHRNKSSLSRSLPAPGHNSEVGSEPTARRGAGSVAPLDTDTSIQSRGHALHPGFGEGPGDLGPAARQVQPFLLAPRP